MNGLPTCGLLRNTFQLSTARALLCLGTLKEFTWDKLFEELSFNAPILLSILRDCTQTRRPRTNRSAVIGMCFAILLKYRYLKMNLIQKIISMILYAGDSTKQVIYYISNVCSIVSQMC